MSRKIIKIILDKGGSVDYIDIMKHRENDPRLLMLAEHVSRTGVRIQEVADKIGVTNRTIYNWLEAPNSRVSPLASRRLNLYLKRTE
jgi:DNA invertase Pin-like site-specific DNA recombinase